jgi:hypothetical protein
LRKYNLAVGSYDPLSSPISLHTNGRKVVKAEVFIEHIPGLAMSALFYFETLARDTVFVSGRLTADVLQRAISA